MGKDADPPSQRSPPTESPHQAPTPTTETLPRGASMVVEAVRSDVSSRSYWLVATSESHHEALNTSSPRAAVTIEAEERQPSSPVSQADMLDMLAAVATEKSRDSLSEHDPLRDDNTSPPSQDFDRGSDDDSGEDSMLGLMYTLTPIEYKCGYCGRLKTSLSTGQDGRVRIRCECGGKHKDDKPRMHAMWHRCTHKRPAADPPDEPFVTGSDARMEPDQFLAEAHEPEQHESAFSQLRK